MNKKQALRWFHRNCGLSIKGVYSITRNGETVTGKDCNKVRNDFLTLVAKIG